MKYEKQSISAKICIDKWREYYNYYDYGPFAVIFRCEANTSYSPWMMIKIKFFLRVNFTVKGNHFIETS